MSSPLGEGHPDPGSRDSQSLAPATGTPNAEVESFLVDLERDGWSFSDRGDTLGVRAPNGRELDEAELADLRVLKHDLLAVLRQRASSGLVPHPAGGWIPATLSREDRAIVDAILARRQRERLEGDSPPDPPKDAADA